jgi:hypothetical protein
MALAAPGVTIEASSSAVARSAPGSSTAGSATSTASPRPPPNVTRLGAARRVTFARRGRASSSSSLTSSASHFA